MPLRAYVAAVLLVALPLAPAHADQPSTASLEAADRAFADALSRHDRAAFVAMFAPDAVSTFPSEKHGPEAIADNWIVFLIDPGTTMLLTMTDVKADGASGTTSGTLAVRGRTADGVQTIPVGTYSLNWRMIDGRWKVTLLGRSGSAPQKTAAPDGGTRGGVGPYRFGMTREEVRRVADCQPYTDVRVTGGLECPHYSFDGHEMNISFIFGPEGLKRIQLWFYEGESTDGAREAVTRVLEFLQRTSGGVYVRGSSLPVTTDAVMKAVNHASPQPGEITHVEVSTPPGPQSETWFSRIGRTQYGYAVMLFADPRSSR